MSKLHPSFFIVPLFTVLMPLAHLAFCGFLVEVAMHKLEECP